ncbi:IS607 family transposase [Aetokthonos hydrillicola Thurmond2011]|jgi:excisionase family DNA binding protein|uniref:IS607 family transposase n=1 Tax=Aetokthonos hydrillicola Thurmond2011 TaxID=2712845 RepID=A0AAP5I408_9CYAN|nr:IS607 family transposase [Aetokthonos hydrillicola]MBO3459269.1 IS607 family transposase [Aetokthonos hydrillicola CCALA 1050]MBW4590579.1 IS607 family transposase [Aetokthonos hydrillicola CCALA 1050]MDR9894344.1 IS607 family transposase [Aetokthonos hydrillicola Thurmond2011]
MHRLDDLLQIGDAAKLKGVSIDTLRRWEKAGKIQAIRTEGGHRRYKVADLLKIDNPNLRYTVIYGRVSTLDKKEDLVRQIGVLELYCQQQGFKEVCTLQDIGSGLNYKKRGLLKLINLLQRNEVERLVITDKDRLLRFGSELIFALCENNGTEVIILNKPVEQEPEQEIVSDVLSIITVMSARLYGKRSRRNLKAMKAMHECAENILNIDIDS